MTTNPQSPGAARSAGGPPLLVPAVAFAAFTLAAFAVLAKTPLPSASARAVLDYQLSHTTGLRVGGFLQFAAALPLAIWAATAFERLRSLGGTAAGTTMALAGGLLASASLALGGLITWTSAETAHLANPATARVLETLSAAAGAAAFVVPFALLIAGVAVPSLIIGLLPRPVAVAGLSIAVAGMVSTATLLTASLDPTLRIGRFGGLIWLIIASVLLPRHRQRLAN